MWKDFYTKLWFEGTWKDPHGIKAICCTTCEKNIYTKLWFEDTWKDPHRREVLYLMWKDICTNLWLEDIWKELLCVSLHDTSGCSDWQRTFHISLQENGCFPVCVFTWHFRWFWLTKILSHVLQENGCLCVCECVCVSLHDTNGGSNGQRSFHNCVAGKWPFFCVCLLVTLQIILF